MDLARMRALAEEFAASRPADDVAQFLDELSRRFSTEQSGRGVNLLTYHRAKGLEWEAVFLPRLLEGEIPFRSARSKADPEEERRLLYVGITRAKRVLELSWPLDGRGGPSPFVDELRIRPRGRLAPQGGRTPASRASGVGPTPGVGHTSPNGDRKRGSKVVDEMSGDPLFVSLRDWRRRRAAEDGVPAYVVFHDSTLAAIAERKPRSLHALGRINGVGPTKLDRYGDDVLDVVAQSV